jgi:NAD(P) transhydrogenase subunit alpha
MASDAATSRAADLAGQAHGLANQLDQLTQQIGDLSHQAVGAAAGGEHASLFVGFLTVFVLAVFVGYYVVWRVTPALHSPLMSVTNAISSVIIVGALIAAGPAGFSFSKVMGFVAVILASVNIFGGFIVTQRMLQMFIKKKPK